MLLQATCLALSLATALAAPIHDVHTLRDGSTTGGDRGGGGGGSSVSCGTNEEYNGRECVCKRGFETVRTGRETSECLEKCTRDEVRGEHGGCECDARSVRNSRNGCESCGSNEIVGTDRSGSKVCVCDSRSVRNSRGTCQSCGSNEIVGTDSSGSKVCVCDSRSVRNPRGTCQSCGSNEIIGTDHSGSKICVCDSRSMRIRGTCQSCDLNEVPGTDRSGDPACVCESGTKKYVNERGTVSACTKIPTCGANEVDKEGDCVCVRGYDKYGVRDGVCIEVPTCGRDEIDNKGTCECKPGTVSDGSGGCVTGGECKDNPTWTDRWNDDCGWYADHGTCDVTWMDTAVLKAECPESCGLC